MPTTMTTTQSPKRRRRPDDDDNEDDDDDDDYDADAIATFTTIYMSPFQSVAVLAFLYYF